MGETKHTPGPWSMTGNSWQYTTVYDADGTPICRLDLEDWGVTEDNQEDLERQQESVALLIVAAPDLLAALKDCLSALDASRGTGEFPDFDAWEKSSRTAIARAEGRSE